MSYERLNEKIQEMKDEMLDSIRESVAICSVRGEPEPDAPYGREVKKALDHALALGERMGFKTGNIDIVLVMLSMAMAKRWQLYWDMWM